MSTPASPLCTLALGRWILSPPQSHLSLSVQLSRNVNSIVSLSYLFQDFISLVLKKVPELSPKFCKWRPEMIVAKERLSSNFLKVTLDIVRWGTDSLFAFSLSGWIASIPLAISQRAPFPFLIFIPQLFIIPVPPHYLFFLMQEPKLDPTCYERIINNTRFKRSTAQALTIHMSLSDLK